LKIISKRPYGIVVGRGKVSKKDIVEVTDKPIIPEAVIAKVKGEDCGAVVTFTGKVRGHSGDKKVTYLEHGVQGEAPEKMLKEIISEVRKRWDVGEIAFCYRKGRVGPGEVTIVIAVAATHRQEAFAACQYAVDRLKQKVTTKEGREDGEVRVGKKG
jgi:molybdopterin synthase catalytic subunit